MPCCPRAPVDLLHMYPLWVVLQLLVGFEGARGLAPALPNGVEVLASGEDGVLDRVEELGHVVQLCAARWACYWHTQQRKVVLVLRVVPSHTCQTTAKQPCVTRTSSPVSSYIGSLVSG